MTLHQNAPDPSLKILSDLVVRSKYARFIKSEQRYETWEDICDRYMAMIRTRFETLVPEEILSELEEGMKNYEFVPSMRGAQFAGRAVEEKNARLFNCCVTAIDHHKRFKEIIYLLLCGCGVGYSVQSVHLEQWDRTVVEPTYMGRRFTVEDSIEGWADAVNELVGAFLGFNDLPDFDYSQIREEGAEITSTGAPAPGPMKLRRSMDEITALLWRKAKSFTPELSSLDVHDIVCHLANAVVAGGVRRSAMICFFDWDDTDMLTCKSPENMVSNTQRYRSNNSAVLVRGEHGSAELNYVLGHTRANLSGDPGFFWTHDRNCLSNPCVEASLYLNSFCNLSSMSARGITTQAEFNRRARCAALFGTMQATYTDFGYIGPEWKERTDADALIGVSITGLGMGNLEHMDFAEAAREAKRVNEEYAEIFGINCAARTTLIKPEGTSSCVLMTPNGAHAYTDHHFIKRLTLYKDEEIYAFLLDRYPDLVEDSTYEEAEAYLTIPIKADEGALVQTEEGMIEFLERIQRYSLEWIRPGHDRGVNYHNVSCTIPVPDEGWLELGNWLWDNVDDYNGVAVFPKDNNFYTQPMVESISEARYATLMDIIGDGVDLSDMKPTRDESKRHESIACAGGKCDLITL